MAELPLLECRLSSIAADIEVTMVESHASLKVRSQRLPKQLLKIVFGLPADDECMLTSVDEIATAVHEMLARIQEEAMLDLN
ncbi:hypothetical protein C1H46_020374 [Malus baccata]|uniref:Uncharacterized protein n=1 Tax=Malus baccata TaxID=106549 RepID=A0A540M5N7_MALBA|nr:hypothetical protein C1H46_020374 [Malus baccata]